MSEALQLVPSNTHNEINETAQVAHIISEIDSVLDRLKNPGSNEFVGQLPQAVDVLEDTFEILREEFLKVQKDSSSILPVVFGSTIRLAVDTAISRRMKYTQDISGLKSLALKKIKSVIQLVFSADDQLQVFYAIFN